MSPVKFTISSELWKEERNTKNTVNCFNHREFCPSTMMLKVYQTADQYMKSNNWKELKSWLKVEM